MRTVLVTGCSVGLGRATALELAVPTLFVFASVRSPALHTWTNLGDGWAQGLAEIPGDVEMAAAFGRLEEARAARAENRELRAMIADLARRIVALEAAAGHHCTALRSTSGDGASVVPADPLNSATAAAGATEFTKKWGYSS